MAVKLVYLLFIEFNILILFSLFITLSVVIRYSFAIQYHVAKRSYLKKWMSTERDFNIIKRKINKEKITVTFVIPSYNEGESIYNTIKCIAESSYTKQRMQIIAVNDCSTDNTLAEMMRAKADFKNRRIAIIDLEKNSGKREGMMVGYKKAVGEYIFFIDSDTYIEKDSVYKYLVDFIDNPEVASVTGMAMVSNEKKNMITRMQALRYYNAFSVVKASESALGTVLCASGCSSMYRKKYLDKIMKQWYEQKFMGQNCTFGDDRSLCLLYTSPSPRDRTRTRMPSSA